MKSLKSKSLLDQVTGRGQRLLAFTEAGGLEYQHTPPYSFIALKICSIFNAKNCFRRNCEALLQSGLFDMVIWFACLPIWGMICKYVDTCLSLNSFSYLPRNEAFMSLLSQDILPNCLLGP